MQSGRTRVLMIFIIASIVLFVALYNGSSSKRAVNARADIGPSGEDSWINNINDWNGDGVITGGVPINFTSDEATGEMLGAPGIVNPVTQQEADNQDILDANNITTISEPVIPPTRFMNSRSLYPLIKSYKTRPRPLSKNTQWSKAKSLSHTLDSMQSKLKSGGWHGPYRLKKKGSDNSWSKAKSRWGALVDAKHRLSNWASGVLYIRSAQHGWIFATKVLSKPKIINLANATPPIDKVYTALKYNFNNWFFYGTFSCSIVPGTSTWSQHAWGNALDFGASGDDQMKTMSNWIVKKAEDGKLPVSQVIHDARVWEPATGWRPYSGTDLHYTHVHVSGFPYLNGTPPCAGG